ncbi:peptidase [Bailinhaonella thermotolerans]|uniref:Peptidase n=2 Tax=Bailinhaonella thermotolerans TaxID=1070861 RepID=A0A3A4A2L6_9ACTN|nr:peptidase [Bailinhaonella thermotolerans]
MLRRTATLAAIPALLIAVAGAAQGSTRIAPPDPVATVASHAAAQSSAEQKRIVSYWTPQRMKSAMPLTLTKSRPAGKSIPPSAGAPAVVEPMRADSPGEPWTGGGDVVKTTGRVFFVYQGRNSSCSGSAVTSANKSTVITAGHCVKLGGQFHTNWVFVPAYNDGQTPYGTWAARSLLTTPQWNASEDINYDVGAAVVNPLNNQRLTDVVGGQGIAFNQARRQQMYAFGYPAAAPYDGRRLIYCSGRAFDDFLLSRGIGLNCNMTGGSSGGPWFLNFSEATGRGTLNSVNSFKYNFASFWMFGPYFGTDAQNLYNTAQNSALT